MEKLADSHLLAGVLDLTTTEVADELMGGVFSAGPHRFDAIARSRVPYLGSCGALDMVNFGAPATVPAHYRQRTLYEHNPQVTLMRTNAEENAAMGRFIAAKLNRMDGPVFFLQPTATASILAPPLHPSWPAAADAALFAAIERDFVAAPNRQLLRTPLHINDPAFAALAVARFKSLLA